MALGRGVLGGRVNLAQLAKRQMAGVGRGDAGGARGPAQRTITETAPQAPSPEVMGLFTQAMERFKPGGEFGKRELSLLARAKKKHMASSAQRMVSAGLGGTTVPMAEEARFEEERGDPLRAGFEETRTSRLNELLMAQAGYLGGLGGRKTTTTAYGGGGAGMGYGGAAPVPQDPSTLASQRMIASWGQPRPQTAAPAVDPNLGRRQLPAGGRIMSGTYYPPVSRFSRNVPSLNL
jgi:hypothetical protein